MNCPQEINSFTCVVVHAVDSLIVNDRARYGLNSRQNQREELPSFILMPSSHVIDAISGSSLFGLNDVADYHRRLPSDPAESSYKG